MRESMKHIFLFSILALFLFGCGGSGDPKTTSASNTTTSAVTETPKTVYAGGSLADLKNFDGRRARDINLWDAKELGGRLDKMMGSEYANMKENWEVEGGMKIEGDVLMLAGCEQDNCADNQYVLFVDTARDNINVQHIKDGKLKTYAEKGEIGLPKPLADEFATIKTSSNIK